MKVLKGFKAVYCDASFFIGLFSKKDTKHRRALELFEEIKENRLVICTCWFVLSEAMTLLLYRYGYSEALAFTNSIDLYRVVDCRESQYHEAVALFKLFGKDRKISFVDALSHVIIKELLHDVPAISFDKDFRTMGLTTIS